MFYDVTLAIGESLPVWPGDPPVILTRLAAEGPGAPSVSQLCLGSHTGTHVDPPSHFIPGAAAVDDLALDLLIGPAWLALVPGPGPIGAADLAGARIPPGTERLLLKTHNSEDGPTPAVFDPGFVGLAEDAARWLLAAGVRLVGIDGPSIEPYISPGEPVHRMLLGAGAVIVEGLALAGVTPGPYQLYCLPLKLAGGDGAPARVVLATEP